MLRAKLASELLGQLNTDGVQSTMLLTREGEMLVCTASAEAGLARDKSIAAIVTNIRTEYGRVASAAGEAAEGPGDVNVMMFDMERGKLASCPVADRRFILCMWAESSVSLGALKRKLEAGAEYLNTQCKTLGVVA